MNVIRTKHGRGFTYHYADGTRLREDSAHDKREKEWIKSLTIPPAWTDVQIDLDRQAKVLATGRDETGKKQYIYNPDWRTQRNHQKFARIQRFARKLPAMRRTTTQQIDQWLAKSQKSECKETSNQAIALDRETVLACMVRLLDTAYFRPGNDKYTRDNESYGLTTLRTKHLEIDGDELVFEYQGKSGVEQVRSVKDEQLARIIRELDDTPGYRIFKYFDGSDKVYVNSDDLNDYIKEVMGEAFSAKDFRTWAGTAVAALALTEFEITDNQTERDKNMLTAIEKVAQRLGNSPAICRENYIDPRILEAYIDGQTIRNLQANISQELQDDYLSADEYATLKLLELRLKDHNA
jgi:DNA topoisomerase-1